MEMPVLEARKYQRRRPHETFVGRHRVQGRRGHTCGWSGGHLRSMPSAGIKNGSLRRHRLLAARRTGRIRERCDFRNAAYVAQLMNCHCVNLPVYNSRRKEEIPAPYRPIKDVCSETFPDIRRWMESPARHGDHRRRTGR